ncbi:uncharacterized protein LOC106658468 [Trichogramma pretiosum]|uniref:uncharacterized protein LOC106658468 n=1 Tax=Trichogramma pretiosum TaxID=7493 RepID=UPI0006C9CCA1|nr:uncharacterized protein LOC106658468 [Trichogramma pretiosum]
MKTNCNYVLQNQVMARSCKCSVSVTSCDIELIKKYPDKFLSLMMSIMRCHELKQNKFWSFEYKKKLKYLVLYCKPSEFIIYLIEQLKMANLFYFYFIFDPLEISISTCQNHKIKIDLAIILVQNAFQFLPVKCDVNNSRYCGNICDYIILTGINVLSFLNNLTFIYFDFDEHNKIPLNYKNIIVLIVIFVFGKLMIHIKANRIYYNEIFKQVFRIINKFYKNLVHIFKIFNYQKCAFSSLVHSQKFSYLYEDFNSNEVNLCVMNFFWFTSLSIDIDIPCVYSPVYIIYKYMQLSIKFIDMSQDITTLTKALDLIDYVLNKNEVQIPHEFLDLSIHDNLTVNLSKLMSNCKVPGILKYTLKILKKYVNSFEITDRFKIIKRCLKFDYESKFRTFIITLLKDNIAQVLSNHKTIYLNSSYNILQIYLPILLPLICDKNISIKINIFDNPDFTLTILNFILFIAIKRKVFNKSVYIDNNTVEFLNLIDSIIKGNKHNIQNEIDILKNESNSVGVEKQILQMENKQKLLHHYQCLNFCLLVEDVLIRIYNALNSILTK